MITNKTNVHFETTVTLTESEARALNALACYGIEPFLDVFYRQLGRSYLSPHEFGIRELFKRIDKNISPELNRIDEAKRLLSAAPLLFADKPEPGM